MILEDFVNDILPVWQRFISEYEIYGFKMKAETTYGGSQLLWITIFTLDEHLDIKRVIPLEMLNKEIFIYDLQKMIDELSEAVNE